ncbi:cation transport ATPase [Gemmobacter serpentinus]|uniref:cation transport ATPase n=1 Tax=Gemmobacter serpentinus TaxID=2652247 RepID=UPI00124E5F66|nr:cation transport ATPase [Gemmobacter serpentinus]
MRISVACVVLAGLLPVSLLPGCVSQGGGVSLSRQPVLAGAVTIAAPKGYCIEPGSRLERGDSALVILGRCAGETTAAPALLTATIGASGSGTGIAGDSATLANWFRSERGRAALSDRGRPGDIRIDRIESKGDVLFLQLRDQGAGGGAQTEGWRAVMPLRGRLVTLTVAGPREAPLPAAAGRSLIGRFADSLASANR